MKERNHRCKPVAPEDEVFKVHTKLILSFRCLFHLGKKKKNTGLSLSDSPCLGACELRSRLRGVRQLAVNGAGGHSGEQIPTWCLALNPCLVEKGFLCTPQRAAALASQELPGKAVGTPFIPEQGHSRRGHQQGGEQLQQGKCPKEQQ